MHFLILPFVFAGLAAKIKNKRHFKSTFRLKNTHLELTSSNHSKTKCSEEKPNNDFIEIKDTQKAGSRV